MINEFTPKQLLFCHEYIVDFNGAKAAIRAGYSKKTAKEQAARLLTKVNVSKKIDQLKGKRIKKIDVTAENVVNEIARIGFADIKDILNIDQDAMVTAANKEEVVLDHVSLRVWEKVDGRLIKSIEQTKDGLRVKLHSKEKMLELLGRHLNIFKEDQEAGTTKFDAVLEKLDQKAEEYVKKFDKSNSTDNADV